MSEVADHLPLKALDLSLLMVLSEGPDYGYGLVKRIAEADMGAITLAPSNLYYVLDRMMKAGLVDEAEDVEGGDGDDDRRQYYRITALGRRVAAAEASRLSEVVRTARRLRITGREA